MVKNTKEKNEQLNFTRWKKCLDDIGVLYTLDDYRKIHDDIRYGNLKFNTKSSYGLDFYKERYFMLDYIEIHKNKKIMMLKKRGNMYDVENVMIQNNMSKSAAEIEVARRKVSTCGSLATFISRYGVELGNVKYQEFSKKCVVSLESCIRNNGEVEGTLRWENYKNTRDSGSLEYFMKINNGNVELATIEHQKFKDLCGETSTNKYYLEQYGQTFIDELSYKKGFYSTIDGFIEKYGVIEGTIKYKECNASKAITLDNMKKIHGEELGILLYDNWKESTYINSTDKSNVSKASCEVFSKLQSALGRSLQFGSKKCEFVLRDIDRMYFYDCYDKNTNTLIEYNGSIWHPSPMLNEEERKTWTVGGYKSSLGYYEALERDAQKNNFAIENGYNLIIVWDYETNSKIKLTKTINNIMDNLNGYSVKNNK